MRIYGRSQTLILFLVFLIFLSQAISAQDLGNLKLELYSKIKNLHCNMPLNHECDCPEAREMKAYIDALLESGITKEEIFYKVAKKYSLNAILDKQIKGALEQRLIKETGESCPRIILDSTAFNFGEVSKKQGKISKFFKLSNKGNSPLIIKSIKTSCPCAFVSLKIDKEKTPYFGTKGSPGDWQSEIKPQESAELELMVDLASPHVRTGRLIRDASILSNDPIYPEVTVRVEAEVKD